MIVIKLNIDSKKNAEEYIKNSAILLQLLYNVGSFENCVGRYRTLKNWEKITKLTKSSENEMNELGKILKNIRKMSGEFVKIPARRVIELFNSSCKEQIQQMQNKQEQK